MLTLNTLNAKPVNHDKIVKNAPKTADLLTPLTNAHFSFRQEEISPFPKTNASPMTSEIPKKITKLAKLLGIETPSVLPAKKSFNVDKYLKEYLFVSL